MKKTIIFLIATMSFTFWCKDKVDEAPIIEDCKTCQLNTYEENVLIKGGLKEEYCGSELAAVLATPDKLYGVYVIKWERYE